MQLCHETSELVRHFRANLVVRKFSHIMIFPYFITLNLNSGRLLMQPASLSNDDDDAKDDTRKNKWINNYLSMFYFFLDLFITTKIVNWKKLSVMARVFQNMQNVAISNRWNVFHIAEKRHEMYQDLQRTCIDIFLRIKPLFWDVPRCRCRRALLNLLFVSNSVFVTQCC